MLGGRNWICNARSTIGASTGILAAIRQPNAIPNAVPNAPMAIPCTKKICMIDAGRAPSVRRMAISACLLVTVITNDETRLNAATAIISIRMMNIILFSTCTAANQVRFCVVQSRTYSWPESERASNGGGALHIVQAHAHTCRGFQSEERLRIGHMNQGKRTVKFIMARLKNAADSEQFIARQ